jgi:uncharacterized protein YbaR (Trm112 family)
MRIAPELSTVLLCPVARQPLIYFPRGERDDDEARGFLLSPSAGLRYRLDAGVPVLLADEAERVAPAEVTRLQARARELGLPGAA